MPSGSTGRNRVLFLAPEAPTLGGGGGGLRSASLLAYLRQRYEVDVATFSLRRHSKSLAAKMWRNGARLVRQVPPLYDRFSGYEDQVAAQIHGHYQAAVVEHFWCASYADALRPHCDRLVLDLHNVESALAHTHARAARWPESWASARFGAAYERLEREWLPKFDAILVASEDDRRRVDHPRTVVYPNAIPEVARPALAAEPGVIIFTGNMEYHPNLEAVRWFHRHVWPILRTRDGVEWRLAGVNPGPVEAIVAGDPRIHVLGPVQDAIETLSHAQVAVVPLLSGSGTRFKILEAWAAGVAVVSTAIGAEGLGARDGVELLIRDDAAGFAGAVGKLLADAARRASLADAGRSLLEEKFTWPVAWRCLEGSGVV